MRTSRLILASAGLAAAVAVVGCGSNAGRTIHEQATGTSGATGTTGGATPVRHYPPIPPGGTDCGIVDEMSGWPTTMTMPTAQMSTCITQAAATGHPARFVVISASDVDSGRKTSDGYALPAGILTTYVVTGPARIEVTVDHTEAGGIVATQLCTGLPAPTDGQPLTPTGCTPP
ncbi:MAG TPA: hypothetical protein VMT43_01435 [Acidimicrobiales bacterium]|nr:hypothetical protein [Acidimicrobiales bacterium]